MKEVNEQIENQVWWQVKTQLLNQVDRQVYWRVNGQLYLAGLNLHGIVSDGTIINDYLNEVDLQVWLQVRQKLAGVTIHYIDL